MPQATRAIRILVADDDRTQRKLARMRLQAIGFEILEAVDGADALATIRRMKPDLVICDVLMPRLDGYALCQELKRDRELSAIPVVLATSGWIEESDRRIALAAGASAMVARTPDLSEILAALESSLQPARSHDPVTGGEAEMDELRVNFLMEAERQLPILDSWLESESHSTRARAIAHQWAGASGFFGFASISLVARHLETLLSETPACNSEGIRTVFSNLKELFSTAISSRRIYL